MQEIYNLILGAIITATASAFGILLLGKLGLRDRIVAESKTEWVSKLFGCDFCLGFWSSFILACLFSIILGSPIYLAIPVISAPVTRLLL